MKIDELMQRAQDAATVRRVFGEPVLHGDVLVVPAAAVTGGGGGGTGKDREGQEGEGGGWGVSARPAGAYVVKDGRVTWRPAVDVNRVVGVVGTVVLGSLFLARRRLFR